MSKVKSGIWNLESGIWNLEYYCHCDPHLFKKDGGKQSCKSIEYRVLGIEYKNFKF